LLWELKTLITVKILIFLTTSKLNQIGFDCGGRTEGGNITVSCSFILNGNTKIFCKDTCEKKEDILLETTEDRAERGRYRIEYERGAVTERATLYVSITQLSMSDSGQYWCGLKRILLDGYKDAAYFHHCEHWLKLNITMSYSHTDTRVYLNINDLDS
uniref:Immunoglobulin V-set domain-containing protein n=1 Tax=Seriola lalandi dorsalis TaxID=1841481 RepID=A0A3B4WFV4_SERLL